MLSGESLPCGTPLLTLPRKGGGNPSAGASLTQGAGEKSVARSRPCGGVGEHHFDQGAGAAAGADLEFGAVGFDQRFGQRQADAAGAGLVRRRRRAERLQGGGDLVVVEALAG